MRSERHTFLIIITGVGGFAKRYCYECSQAVPPRPFGKGRREKKVKLWKVKVKRWEVGCCEYAEQEIN